MISGAFSLTRQAIQLGYLPRMTSGTPPRWSEGQIYMPEVNTAIGVGCLLIVLAFRDTSALGAAYGIAVTGTFMITTILFYMVVAAALAAGRLWQAALLLRGVCFVVDLAFFGGERPQDHAGRLGADRPRRRALRRS